MEKSIKYTVLFLFVISICSCKLIHIQKELLSETKIPLNDKVTISLGAGGNSGVIEMSDKVVIIDTKFENKAKKFKESLSSQIKNKSVIIINTHLHDDHTGGNYLFDAEKIYIGNYSDAMWNNEMAEQNQINKLNYVKITETLIIKDTDITLHVIPVGNSHTSNDIVVYYEEEKTIFVGDLLFYNYHPFLDEANKANVELWIKIIHSILENYDIEKVIAGHGAITNSKALEEGANYFEDIIENIDNEKQLKQIKKKYNHFYNIPGLTSYKKTVDYIKKTLD